MYHIGRKVTWSQGSVCRVTTLLEPNRVVPWLQGASWSPLLGKGFHKNSRYSNLIHIVTGAYLGCSPWWFSGSKVCGVHPGLPKGCLAHPMQLFHRHLHLQAWGRIVSFLGDACNPTAQPCNERTWGGVKGPRNPGCIGFYHGEAWDTQSRRARLQTHPDY